MKSHKKLMELVECVYLDATTKCTADVSDLRDLMTIRSRVKSEGLSFLTITLPNFAKDFERSLAEGHIDPARFMYFEKRGAIPAFLQGMLGQLFDCETGRLVYDECRDRNRDAPSVIDGIRQICLTFKKLELECTRKRVNRAVLAFVQTECDLSSFSCNSDRRGSFIRVSHFLWDPIISRIETNRFRPKHGPGATADGVSGNQKYRWRYWHERLDNYFPLLDSAYVVRAALEEEFELVTLLREDEEIPVKVSPVPKTLKGPRIIAVEPACMQYAQQAIRDELYNLIEADGVTAGHVNFRDQSVNRQLAMVASRSGEWATLDLSDASDRVPADLALDMFDSHPGLQGAIAACRSTHAKLPNGSLVGPLRKFASMGSALCFPIEAMYFYTACVALLLECMSLPVTADNIRNVSQLVYVYGDDIVLPSRHAEAVAVGLQEYNCKVNMSKSFWTGKFRESCGMEAYDGVDVTPIYVRRVPPCNRRQAADLISWVKTAGLFYKKGFWRTASAMYQHVEKILGPLPVVQENSSALGRISFLGRDKSPQPLKGLRWNPELHRLEVRAWVPVPVYRADPLDGYAALQKSLSLLEGSSPQDQVDPLTAIAMEVAQDFSGRFERPIARDPKHLKRTARYGDVALSRRWVPA